MGVSVEDEQIGEISAIEAARQRLLAARWPILAALGAIALITVAGTSPIVLALSSLMVVVAGLFVPLRTLRQRRIERAVEAGQGPDAQLSADDLAGAVSDPLIVFDRSGAVVKMNAAAAAAFSRLPFGASLALRFRAPEMQGLITDVVANGKLGSVDYHERAPVDRWYRVTASPAGETRTFFVMVFRDQSEVRRIDRMRADFIANASHELRTPLASVAGFIDTLRGPARDDAAARDQFLQIMQGQTSRMARLIDDLLSLSRLEMKSFLDPSARVDLVPLLGGVADALRPLAAETGVRIDYVPGNGPAEVAGMGDELIQVFENLLENACKYGRVGGKVELTINHEGSDGGIDVSVRDFGDGIPEEHIPRLTERFYRVDAESSRGQKGTGLGLAIVKHILTRHKARLSVRSKPGEGSVFTVHFPPVERA